MSAHLLEINMKMKTSEVTAGLKSVETSVGRLIKMAQDFGVAFSNAINSASQQATTLLGTATQIAAATKQITPPQIMTADQQAASFAIKSALEEMAKLSPTVTNENLKQLHVAREHLTAAIRMGNNLKDRSAVSEDLVKANTALGTSTQEQLRYLIDMNDMTHDNWDIIRKLSTNNIKGLTIDKHRSKLMTEYVKNLNTILKTDKTLLTQMGLSVDEAKNIAKNWDNIGSGMKKGVNYSSNIFELLKKIVSVIPGMAVLVSTFVDPLGLIGNELTRIHDLWKKNNTAANNFLKNGKTLGESLYKSMVDISSVSGAMIDNLAKAGYSARGTIITLEQAQEGLNATLQSTYKQVIANTTELKMHAVMATQTAQATGLAATEVADLSLQMRALHKAVAGETDELKLMNAAIADSAMLMDSLTNISAKYRFSSKDMSVVTSNLQKHMSQLNSSYASIRASNGKMIPPAVQYTNIMAAMGNAANKAGQSGAAAMNALANALENPLDNIILLGKTAFSGNIGEQMTAVGETAVKVQAMMAGKSLAQQQIIAGIYGKSVTEINALAAAQKGLNDKYKDLSPQARSLKIAEETASSQKANAARTAASADAVNNLKSALDGLTIVFGELARLMQPVIDGFAAFMRLPYAPQITAIAGAVTFLVGAIAGLSIVKRVLGGMDALASSAKAVGEAGGVSAKGGGLKGFAEGFVGAVNAFKTVNWASMLKAGAMIAIIGVSLGIGIAAIGLALTLMPPGKIAEFLVMTIGLVAATFAMSALSIAGPAALIGALLLVAVGAAIAASIALIGLALMLMPPDSVTAFIALTAGLVIATGLMAALALIAPLALVGAGLLLATGVALAAAISVIGLAFTLFDPEKIAAGISAIGESVSGISVTSGVALVSLAAGLVAFSAAMAGGAIMSFFSGGIVENATRMGQALTQLVDPIAKLGALGSTVGSSFTQIADGLDKFTSVLDKGGGLFGTNFQKRATELASALQTMVGPISEMNKAQAGAMDAQAKDLARVQAEEIKSALAVTIERSQDKEDASLKALIEIRESIDKLTAAHERSEMAADMKKLVKNTKDLLDEIAMGGSMGNTTANHNYT